MRREPGVPKAPHSATPKGDEADADNYASKQVCRLMIVRMQVQVTVSAGCEGWHSVQPKCATKAGTRDVETGRGGLCESLGSA